jgi:CheY-like chemotaxis protein
MGTLLIAQRDSDERTRLLMALQIAGHTATGAASGAEAVQMLETSHFDAAVIDEELPDMYGTELILALRKVPGYETLPAVLLLPACAEDGPPTPSESPTPDVPHVWRVYAPAMCAEIQATVEVLLAECGGEVDRHVVLEQRRELWSDVSSLQRLARSVTR